MNFASLVKFQVETSWLGHFSFPVHGFLEDLSLLHSFLSKRTIVAFLTWDDSININH